MLRDIEIPEGKNVTLAEMRRQFVIGYSLFVFASNEQIKTSLFPPADLILQQLFQNGAFQRHERTIRFTNHYD
jgi:hypothetical protein